MLLYLLLFLSATAASLLCLYTDAFYSLQFLWMLPVGFAGAFLVLTILALAVLVLVCLPVNPNKHRNKDSRFYRGFLGMYITFILSVARVRLHTEGIEKMPKDGRVLLVSNHIDNIDPGVFLHVFRKKQLAFVAKREAGKMFLINKFLSKLMCPLINRENDKEALKAILRCIWLLKEDKTSVGIFPEGRICPERQLQHLKPGVFKIAQKAKVPIVVCTLQNTQYALKNFLKLKPTDIHVHLLDVIPAEEVVEANTVDLAHRIYKMMADDLGPENVLPYPEENA